LYAMTHADWEGSKRVAAAARGAVRRDDVPPGLLVRALLGADRAWARSYLLGQWGSDVMAVSGGASAPELFHPHEHDGFIASIDRAPAGLLTYRLNPPGSLEVTSLTAAPRRRGVGTALMAAAEEEARRQGCRRLWLVTTNDNVEALRFYQRRGLRLVA